MGWLLNLFETYDSNLEQVGRIEIKPNGEEYTLLPISHTTQTAHIEVNVTDDGRFHSAFLITNSKDATTIIPCTEDSASRSGTKIAPYPLHDKLSYVAGDFVNYGGTIKKEEPFAYYIKQLEDWANSPYATPKVISIYKYLKQRRLIRDLVTAGIIVLDDNGQLINKWGKKYENLFEKKPEIFSVATGGQESAFIRFNVYSPDKIYEKVWKDSEVYNSFIRYYQDKTAEEDICYVTGQRLPITEKHANKIRNPGDKAKLISANDSSGFTYRGRFTKGVEAAAISYEASQKAHNALKWLINRQGKIIDNRVFLIWGNDLLDIPDTMEDTFDIYSLDFLSEENKSKKISFTNQDFAREFSKAIDGYKANLHTESKVNILVLDSATTGRMAVLYYRNMDIEVYLEKLLNWHSTCVWLHSYKKNSNGKYVSFLGAPATRDIAFAAYGPNANSKVVKGLMERILPCIIDGKRIPIDIVRSAYNRAKNPAGLEKWEWEKTLSIFCALINKEEGIGVALDPDINDRDYLFGRLLAIADVLERRALGSDESRATNAVRYMNAFAQHPERTWKTIQASLQPYQVKLGTKSFYLTKLMDEVASKIRYEDFNNKPLSGKFLLGFYSQRHELYQKNVKIDDNQE